MNRQMNRRIIDPATIRRTTLTPRPWAGRWRTICSLSLVYALILSMTGGFRVAAQSGPQPGMKDPVDNYTFFPSHDLVAFAPGDNLSVHGYRADQNLNLTGAFSYDQAADADQFVAAQGHIWRPQDEQVVYARRLNGNNLAVSFVADSSTSDPSYVINDFQGRLNNGSSDFMSIAAGDLDKISDSQGNNHDEVVVAYATSDGDLGGFAKVAVLDYTQPATAPPSPVAVTSVYVSWPIAFAYYPNGFQPRAIAVDNTIGVAVGDFDGDGLKEIAAVYHNSGNRMIVSMLRYTNDGQGNRTLKEVATGARQAGAEWAGTLSVAAGDFDGKGKDELLVGLSEWTDLDTNGNYTQDMGFDVWQADSNLNITKTVTLGSLGGHIIGINNLGARGRIQVSPGLFKYDPQNGFDLNRRQFAAAWNTPDGNLLLTTYQVSDDLTTISQLSQSVWGPPTSNPGAINQRFSIAAGAYKGNAATPPPLWGIALSYWPSSGSCLLATLDSNLVPSSSQYQLSSGTVDDAGRYPVVPADLDGKSIYLGAPVHFLIDGIVNTDFILQEPPKHAFYDNRPRILINNRPQTNPTYGQIVTVSRYDSTNVALKTSTGTTYAGKSTDKSDWSIGASVTASAGNTVGFDGALTSAKASVDVTGKVGYDYNRNKDNYNSNYGQRTVTQTEQTDHDDKLLGRIQTIDVWRYRVYGVSTTDQQDNPANAFYEVALPGPTVTFDGGGKDKDWYQPKHENGNILSYPQPSTSTSGNTFTPPDLGAYRIACPDENDAACVPCSLTTDPACTPFSDGKTLTKPVQAPLVPASQNYFNGTSGTLSYDSSSTIGSGTDFSYSHSLSESLDVKVAYKAKLFVTSPRASVDVELHNNNTWGNETTSDTSTTGETGITLSRSSGDSNQAYAFYPVFYTTQDGTIKVAHAVDNPANQDNNPGGGAFWAGMYGRKADPALNLPSRFSPTYGPDGTNLTGWAANYLDSRKKMRGFFVRSTTPNQATGTYDLLASTPLAGDKVRLDASVYNYSTAVEADNLTVRFQVIGYNSGSDTEIPFTDSSGTNPCPTGTTLDATTGRCTIGDTIVPQLNPLQMASATYDWDTTGFGPSTGGQSSDYRVYVVLDPGNSIDETYESEDPNTDYKCVDGGGNTCNPALPTGVDPGQNNEGFGRITIQHPSINSAQDAAAFSADVSLGKDSLGARNASGHLKFNNVPAQIGRPLSLRAKIYSDLMHTATGHLLVYDGHPDKGGRMIAGKIIHTGNTKGAGDWFEWTPTRLGKHALYAKVLERQDDVKKGNNVRTMTVNVVPADHVAPELTLTLTPNRLWPADGEFVPVKATISVRDDNDKSPVVRLEAITSNEDNDAGGDVEGAAFGTDDRRFKLRAEVGGQNSRSQRVYTIVYSATDWEGNKTFARAQVIVPQFVRR